MDRGSQPPPYPPVYSPIAPTTQSMWYGGLWIRFFAYLIDYIFISIAAVILGIFLVRGPSATFNVLLPALTFGAASAVYFIPLWSSGGSLGMRVLGLEVVDAASFTHISLAKATLRFIGFLISTFFCDLGFLWVAVDARKQGWHDHIAGTLVLHKA